MVLRSGACPRLRGIALLPERHGQQPGARRAFPRAPRSARAVAAGFRIIRRRCPEAPVLHRPFRLLPPPSPPAFRTPKQAILGSRTWKNSPLCPKNSHFGIPTLGKRLSVPQNRAFWGPEPRKTPLRAPKQGILGSRTRKISPSLGKIGTFAHPWQGKRRSVGQNRHFCPSTARKTALRWAKQGFLPIRGRENSAPLGKTGFFAHPRQGKQRSVGQNRHFCPSREGKTALRWAK